MPASPTARPGSSARPGSGATPRGCSARCSRARPCTTGRRSDRRSRARPRPPGGAPAPACCARSGTASAVPEAVADAPHGQDVLRRPRLVLELLAKVADVDVDRPRVAVVGALPERLEQHPAAEHAPWGRREGAEELEL